MNAPKTPASRLKSRNRLRNRVFSCPSILHSYQIAKDVTAADLAKVIGATDLCGPDQIVIEDIEPFDAAKPSSLIYQSDPALAKTLAVRIGCCDYE